MRRRLLDLALFGLCLCLAPAGFQSSDPNADLASTAGVELGQSAQPTTIDAAELARRDPVALLEAGLRRYRDEVQGYTCVLAKHERLGGKLLPPEVIRCAFSEKPFSVYMHWLAGHDQAEKTLFVQGENGNKVLIRPHRPLAQAALRAVGKYYVDRSPDDPQVRGSSRYTVHEFGIARGMERTYLAWKAARERGALRVDYLGLQAVPEAGGRVCHVLLRHCDPPEEDGLTELTIAIDRENWLQVGSVLMARDGLIGTYHFRDVELNPKFPAGQFMPEALK